MDHTLMKRVLRCAAGFAAGLWLALACSYAPLASDGGGSRGGNPVVTGTIAGPDGAAARDVRVFLIAHNYNPLTDTLKKSVTTGTTDSLGTFSIIAPDTGWYTIEATGSVGGARLIRFKVKTARDSISIVPLDTMRTPGAIKVVFPKGYDLARGYVYVPGTTIANWAPEAGEAGEAGDTIMLDSVPAGILPVLYLSHRNSAEKIVIRHDVPVLSNDTTVIQNPQWSYCRRIILNTSESGAGVKGDAYGFPVLVRLTAGNFDFTQAQNSGGDIRFTTPAGAPLSHEIEQWEVAGLRAAIWVKVDTVYGNNSGQFITMYWGNPAAFDSSNSAVVFDTADRFQGVWHFSDDVSDPVRDATVNGYHGLSPDTARPQVADGVVGKCRVFDGVNDYITMPYTADSKLNFPVNGYYTVSAWVKVDTLDGLSHLIVAKGYEQYFLRFTYFPTNSPLWEFSEFGATDYWNVCTAAATSGQWVLLTGVGQGNRQSLYCNGVVVDSTPNTYQNSSLSRNTSYDLSIGKFLEMITLPNNNEGYCFFKGSIDEVRILSAARSSDWVRLSYMNQRTDDRLVVFK